MNLTRGAHDPFTSEEVGLRMDFGIVREFEIVSTFSLKALFK